MKISTAIGAAVLVAACTPAAPDAPRDLFESSEGKVYVDRFTGCQYLVIPSRAITPRLDATGRPMCRPAPAPSQLRSTMQARDA